MPSIFRLREASGSTERRLSLAKVFISYRRDDAKWQAREIYRALTQVLPRDSVFIDVDSIPPGTDFVTVLEGWVDQCDILLALIGPGWLEATDPKTGRHRLDNPNDFVRIELRKGLARGIAVVPVLLDGAPIPDRDRLPDDLKQLTRRHAQFIELRTVDTDVEHLIRKLGLARTTAQQGQGQYSPTEVALANSLMSAYVRQALKATKPNHRSLGKDSAVARELTKLNREKGKENVYEINLPVACPLINPLTFCILDLFRKDNLQKYLPAEEYIPWDYQPKFHWDIYREEPIPEDAADPYPHVEFSDDPATRKIQQVFLASRGVPREVCDTLIVAALSALQSHFLRGSLDFNSASHVAEAATALSNDSHVQTVTLNLAVVTLKRDAAPEPLPVWVPRNHTVARIIRTLLSTELPHMLPENLHSITVPGINIAAMLPPSLPNGFAYPIDYLEELLAKRPMEEQFFRDLGKI